MSPRPPRGYPRGAVRPRGVETWPGGARARFRRAGGHHDGRRAGFFVVRIMKEKNKSLFYECTIDSHINVIYNDHAVTKK